MCVFVFFSCLSQAELCQGGGARGPTKNGRRRRHLFDASITSINNCKSHIAEWCIRRFASKNEVHHLSEENSGGRAAGPQKLIVIVDVCLMHQ